MKNRKVRETSDRAGNIRSEAAFVRLLLRINVLSRSSVFCRRMVSAGATSSLSFWSVVTCARDQNTTVMRTVLSAELSM
ncbi:hypothetical protein PROFUN_11929 [Planoprotostelium fungivorum]|uniref:Uncharacterized protein n=1 Tax=Planoprotostelium fungivorum TaxID=1890364 RepID=A0A2P6N8U5_9EUKA|nr:hypothetical protein PROFUN_11929 [Planoprotostelium fungivorum]